MDTLIDCYKRARRNARSWKRKWKDAKSESLRNWYWEEYTREGWYARGLMKAMREWAKKERKVAA